METMTIYRTTDNATLEDENQSQRENVWGTEMLVKTIDASDKDTVTEAKANGWRKDPQEVIDENETRKLEAENKLLQKQIQSAKAIERVAELEAENDKLKAEIAELKKSKPKATAKTETKAEQVQP